MPASTALVRLHPGPRPAAAASPGLRPRGPDDSGHANPQWLRLLALILLLYRHLHLEAVVVVMMEQPVANEVSLAGTSFCST